MKRIISLGAGVQSSAMLLMALEGRFGDMPDCAIFADTGWEPGHVYEWLKVLTERVAPFPIHHVKERDLGEDYLKHRRRAAIPAFSTSGEGRPIMMSRFCSKSYKVEVIYRTARRIVGPKGQAESWIGISTDEAHRAGKSTGMKWITNRWPLIEAGLSRIDCFEYVLAKVGKRPPKSACIFCPFHGDKQWIDLKQNHPADFAKAVEFDREIRDIDGDQWDRPRFLHRSMVPLDKVQFMHESQLRMFEDGFGNECDGVCGT